MERRRLGLLAESRASTVAVLNAGLGGLEAQQRSVFNPRHKYLGLILTAYWRWDSTAIATESTL
jgi:hypothetical protein